MRGVLDKIIAHKKIEVAERQRSRPRAVLLKEPMTQRNCISLAQAITNGSGVIAEFKRASPSKGVIREQAQPVEIAQMYARAGASAISVLTDEQFFKGSENDLRQIREVVVKPLLRKDFIIDPYQVVEAKAMGADCILLIAAVLKAEELLDLHSIAEDFGLEVLVEIHDQVELEKLSGREKIVGINNRNLDTFEVDIANSIRMAAQLPDVVRISESGLGSQSNLAELQKAGFQGFLVGETFMKADDPGIACEEFIKQLGSA